MTFYHQSSRIVVCCLKWAMFWQTWLSVCSLHYGVLPLVLRAAEQNKHFICPQWRSCYHGPCSNYCHYCQLSAIKYLNSNKSSWHMYNVAKYRSAHACPGVSAATGATHATAVKTGYKEHTRRSQDIDGDIILIVSPLTRVMSAAQYFKHSVVDNLFCHL